MIRDGVEVLKDVFGLENNLEDTFLKPLASKVKSLALKPSSPQNCPVLGRGQHYFLSCCKRAKVMTFFCLRLKFREEFTIFFAQKPFFSENA